jgi:hypothetical protein
MKRITGLVTMTLFSVAIILFAPQVFAATAPAVGFSHYAYPGMQGMPVPNEATCIYHGTQGIPAPNEDTCTVDQGQSNLGTSKNLTANTHSATSRDKLSLATQGEGTVKPFESYNR